MALFQASRVKVSTSTSGTADFGLGTAPDASFRSFSGASVPNGATVDYVAWTATEFETGTGTYNSAGPTLTRDTIDASSNSNAKVTFGSSPTVAITFLPKRIVGTTELWIPASSFLPQQTNGPSRGIVELGTNLQILDTIDFDTTTQEFASLVVKFPKRWDLGTATFIPHWTAASGSGNVVWALEGAVSSNDDPLNPSWGTEQTSDDTLLAANDEHRGPVSSAITFGGTPTDGDLLWLRIKRNVASDTLGVDAKLIGVEMFITTAASTDA
jgi:hypothetical protein